MANLLLDSNVQWTSNVPAPFPRPAGTAMAVPSSYRNQPIVFSTTMAQAGDGLVFSVTPTVDVYVMVGAAGVQTVYRALAGVALTIDTGTIVGFREPGPDDYWNPASIGVSIFAGQSPNHYATYGASITAVNAQPKVMEPVLPLHTHTWAERNLPVPLNWRETLLPGFHLETEGAVGVVDLLPRHRNISEFDYPYLFFASLAYGRNRSNDLSYRLLDGDGNFPAGGQTGLWHSLTYVNKSLYNHTGGLKLEVTSAEGPIQQLFYYVGATRDQLLQQGTNLLADSHHWVLYNPFEVYNRWVGDQIFVDQPSTWYSQDVLYSAYNNSYGGVVDQLRDVYFDEDSYLQCRIENQGPLTFEALLEIRLRDADGQAFTYYGFTVQIPPGESRVLRADITDPALRTEYPQTRYFSNSALTLMHVNKPQAINYPIKALVTVDNSGRAQYDANLLKEPILFRDEQGERVPNSWDGEAARYRIDTDVDPSLTFFRGFLMGEIPQNPHFTAYVKNNMSSPLTVTVQDAESLNLDTLSQLHSVEIPAGATLPISTDYTPAALPAMWNMGMSTAGSTPVHYDAEIFFDPPGEEPSVSYHTNLFKNPSLLNQQYYDPPLAAWSEAEQKIHLLSDYMSGTYVIEYNVQNLPSDLSTLRDQNGDEIYQFHARGLITNRSATMLTFFMVTGGNYERVRVDIPVNGTYYVDVTFNRSENTVFTLQSSSVLYSFDVEIDPNALRPRVTNIFQNADELLAEVGVASDSRDQFWSEEGKSYVFAQGESGWVQSLGGSFGGRDWAQDHTYRAKIHNQGDETIFYSLDIGDTGPTGYIAPGAYAIIDSEGPVGRSLSYFKFALYREDHQPLSGEDPYYVWIETEFEDENGPIELDDPNVLANPQAFWSQSGWSDAGSQNPPPEWHEASKSYEVMASYAWFMENGGGGEGYTTIPFPATDGRYFKGRFSRLGEELDQFSLNASIQHGDQQGAWYSFSLISGQLNTPVMYDFELPSDMVEVRMQGDSMQGSYGIEVLVETDFQITGAPYFANIWKNPSLFTTEAQVNAGHAPVAPGVVAPPWNGSAYELVTDDLYEGLSYEFYRGYRTLMPAPQTRYARMRITNRDTKPVEVIYTTDPMFNFMNFQEREFSTDTFQGSEWCLRDLPPGASIVVETQHWGITHGLIVGHLLAAIADSSTAPLGANVLVEPEWDEVIPEPEPEPDPINVVRTSARLGRIQQGSTNFTLPAQEWNGRRFHVDISGATYALATGRNATVNGVIHEIAQGDFAYYRVENKGLVSVRAYHAVTAPNGMLVSQDEVEVAPGTFQDIGPINLTADGGFQLTTSTYSGNGPLQVEIIPLPEIPEEEDDDETPVIITDTYSLKGFLSFGAFVNNARYEVAPLGELSVHSRTYAKDRALYSIGSGTNPSTAVELSVFSSRTHAGQRLDVPTAYSVLMSEMGRWFYQQTVTGIFTADPEIFRQQLLAQYNGRVSDVTVGPMVQQGTMFLPEFVTFYVRAQSLPGSWTPEELAVLERSRVKIWFSDAAFASQYDEYELEFIAPIPRLDDFFRLADQVKQDVAVRTIPELMHQIRVLADNKPYTFVKSVNFDYHDRVDRTHTFPTTWTFIIYGAGGDNIDAIKEGLAEWILDQSEHTREEWAEIFPDIFTSTEFILIPMFNQYAVPNLTQIEGVYSPTVNLKNAQAMAKLLAMGTKYTEAHILEKLAVFGSTYKSIALLAVGGPENRRLVNDFAKQWPDYMAVSTTSLDFNRMQPKTQEWIQLLFHMLKVAETMTDFSDIPLTMTRLRRTNAQGRTIMYLVSSFDNVQYLVTSKQSVLQHFPVVSDVPLDLASEGAEGVVAMPHGSGNGYRTYFEGLGGRAPYRYALVSAANGPILSQALDPITGVYTANLSTAGGNAYVQVRVADETGTVVTKQFTLYAIPAAQL